MEFTQKPEFSDSQWRRSSAAPSVDRRPTRQVPYPALPPRLARGDRIGEFRIVRELACGSNSTVFEAEQLALKRSVALKVLSAHLAVHADAVLRFRMESALAERVCHSSIVPIYGSGIYRDYHFYAMRLERGNTLVDLTSDAVLHRDEVFYVDVAERFVPLVRAVQLLHESGVVHRDLKPSNILINAEGRFVLTDFGSALDAKHRDRLLEGCLGGTVLYMSPLQLTPGADPYDIRGDVYSLGFTLYELCTGTSPFPHCSDRELARLKLTRLPVAPRRLNGYIPMALDAIIRRAIEIHPGLGYESAEELAFELERFAGRKKHSAKRK